MLIFQLGAIKNQPSLRSQVCSAMFFWVSSGFLSPKHFGHGVFIVLTRYSALMMALEGR
jgi:hypothetical protein